VVALFVVVLTVCQRTVGSAVADAVVSVSKREPLAVVLFCLPSFGTTKIRLFQLICQAKMEIFFLLDAQSLTLTH
jgi:hypothetical protein